MVGDTLISSNERVSDRKSVASIPLQKMFHHLSQKLDSR